MTPTILEELEPAPRPGWVFVDWSAHCSRSENFARRVGMKFMRRHRPHSGPFSFAFKYAYQFGATTWDLLRERPRVVWCMSPSPLAAVPVWLYCTATGAKFAIDAHTGAFEGTPWAKVRGLQLFLSRKAELTAVTNPFLQALVEAGETEPGRTLIVPDVPTELEAVEHHEFGAGYHAVYVASYSADEPFEVIIDAARRVPDITIWVTGKPKGKARELLEAGPSNVKRLGFLSRDKYLAAIAGANVVVALTTRDHTMQRAAYEAIYLGTPVIVSDWPILRENFDSGTLLVQNSGEALATALSQAKEQSEELKAGAALLREKKLARWSNNYQKIVERLERA